MRIKNVVHEGLRRFIADDDAAGLQAAAVTKVRRILSFLQDMEREDEIGTVPHWKAHPRARGRLASRSVAVTEHCRLTFQIDQTNAEIIDLDCGDCR
ncbi:MAG TPA: type II toxin-antitoxin system RelE/ParE family toxin [Acidiphilium sp.]|nr:MAG: plasmid maintenance system killer [Acidiphilium sp. 21-60-14]OYV90406.1 MAG: plasmid maintenance system killer [Acidiphilium sp. 37-60-79]OZB40461.1 MAG: plasmid maintenance system killer [Acidiphilium sp. 34-60-192]HQT88954.1 type II toxin-antitoxin system RelE/ParE family toxin [Acidiphilium sp.]HQU25140.1 type II toxin-antitoxin system RelE/ParE family toxin [Acidiphilium sp.]